MRDEDERLRQAIRVGNIGIFDHDHENDLLFWSAEMRQIYGWDSDERGELSKVLLRVHPDDLDRVVAAVRKAHQPDGDGAFDIEYRIIDVQGRLRWVLTRSRTHFGLVLGKRGPVRTIGAVQDVTERRVADERLRVLDTVLSSSARAIAIADPRGTLTFANAALCRLWGYSEGEVVLGRSLFEFWKTPDQVVALAGVMEKGIVNVEMPARRVDGISFHLGITAEAVCDAKGALRQILVTFQDITESKRAQDALRLQGQAIASSLTGIAMTDAAGKIIYANGEFVRLTGSTGEQEVLGRSLWDICEPNTAQSIAKRVTRTGAFQGEISARKMTAGATSTTGPGAAGSAGPAMYLNLSARALLGPRGETVNIVASFADVTDRKRLEAQLMQAQKMESVGRLAGGVAHDFNNLLTVISGGLELGMVDLPVEHPGRGCLIDAAAAAQSAAALTRQLLAFSRKEIIAPKLLDLNEVALRVEKMILRLLGEDIHLETICSTGLPPIVFDPGQMEQIILNLAVNARDAMPGGGRLTIETSQVHLDEEYAHRHVDASPGHFVVLAISDNGAGLTADASAHLFEPFFTTKGPGKGTGLGLAMVYGAVRQNGGRIEVYSEVNQGTTFRIYLPVSGPPAPIPVVRELVAANARTASILLVEDDLRVRSFAKNVLTRFGHVVHAFANGEETLQALPSLHPRPELLVTDVVMPGMNGIVLAESVTAALPGIPVLFVSGYTQNVIVNHGVLNEEIEFLAKPYSVEQLARRICEVLDAAKTSAPGGA